MINSRPCWHAMKDRFSCGISKVLLLKVSVIGKGLGQIVIVRRSSLGIDAKKSPVKFHNQNPIHRHQRNADTVTDQHSDKTARIRGCLISTECLRADKVSFKLG